MIALAACKREPDPYVPEEGLDYFPLEVGKQWIYEIDSTIYDPDGLNGTVYAVHGFLKEEITDTIHGIDGTVIYMLEQWFRPIDTLPWQFQKVVFLSLEKGQAIRTEDNLRFIKLVFPLSKGKSWDGNIHFSPFIKVTVAGETLEMFKGWSYRVLSLDDAETIGDHTFEQVATIRNADEENLIELRRVIEKYARGVGLVAREMWILDTQCIEDCLGMEWEQKAEKGFILRQTLIDHN